MSGTSKLHLTKESHILKKEVLIDSTIIKNGIFTKKRTYKKTEVLLINKKNLSFFSNLTLKMFFDKIAHKVVFEEF